MMGEKTIILHGDSSLVTAECSLKTLTKSWEEGDRGYLVEVQNQENEKSEEAESETSERGEEEGLLMIQALLHHYKDVSEALGKLPSKREMDHRILTLEE